MPLSLLEPTGGARHRPPRRHADRRRALVPAILILLAACTPGSSDGGATPTPTAVTAAPTPAAGVSTPTPTAGSATPTPTAATAACSAGSIRVEVPLPDGPAPVARMRDQIIEAALDCDYRRLQELALEPDGSFQYSRFEESAGPDAQPAAFWEAREGEGKRWLASLVEILITDPSIRPVTEPEGPGSGSADSYYNYPGPNMPDMSGYSTSITSRGDWIFFLGPE